MDQILAQENIGVDIEDDDRVYWMLTDNLGGNSVLLQVMCAMKAYSYFELARCFPSNLLLVEDAALKSRSLDLLCLAVSRVVKSDRIDISRFVPYGGEFSRLSTEDVSDLNEILSLNEDALFVTTMAVEHGDFFVPARPHYGTSRVTEATMQTMLAVSSLQDILCVQGRLGIHEGRADEATTCIGNLLGLSNMLCAGGGDTDLYQWGDFGRMRALWNVREFLTSPHSSYSIEALHRLTAALESSIDSTGGYLQSCLSDYIRDVVVTFAENGDDLAASADLLRWLNNRLVRDLLSSAQPVDERDAESTTSVDLKVQAIAAALESNPRPFDAVETTRELARLYDLFRAAFSDRLDVRMSDIERQSASEPLWPEEFQLTCNYGAALPERLVAQAATLVSTTPNALGRLILRDIARVADSIVQRLLIHPWRTRLEIEATMLMIGACEYQLRFGEYPGSVEELSRAGILGRELRDPLAGSPLTISPDRRTVIGPSIREIRTRIPMPQNVPDLQWTIPAVNPPTVKVGD